MSPLHALKSEADTRSLLTVSSDSIWVQDAGHRFIDLTSLSAASNQGFDFSDIVGRARWELPEAVALSMSWDEHRALLQAREPFRNFEFTWFTTKGVQIFMTVAGIPIFDEESRFIGYRGTNRDIGMRKRAEAALRASENRFRSVVASLAEAVVLRDRHGNIIDCNGSAEQMFGRTLAQIKGSPTVGSDWHILRQDGSRMPNEEWPTFAAVRTGLPQSGVLIWYRKDDGSDLWASVNVRTLYDENNAVSGFVTTYNDVSALKRSELEIARLNTGLEDRVRQRTTQLEAAIKELEAFSYSVAHDLRAPLSTIDGFSVLLKNALAQRDYERVDHCLTRVRTAAQRMGELTDGLLSLSKLSRASLRSDMVDLSAEALHILKALSENDPARQVKTRVDTGLLVQGDCTLLRQVLDNLICNAWKFTSKNPNAAIWIGSQVGSDQETQYFVQDNGVGFDMAHAGKLFDPFQRLHSPDDFPGSGVGLATVNRIITRHGGRIRVESGVGRGSTFYFTVGTLQSSADAGEISYLGKNELLLATDSPGASGAATGVRSVDGSDKSQSFELNAQQLRSLFHDSPIGMTLLGLDARWLMVNNALCQMVGYSEAEIRALSIWEITHPDDIEADILQRKKAVEGVLENYRWEKRIIHKAGHVVRIQVTCTIVRDASRKPLYFLHHIVKL